MKTDILNILDALTTATDAAVVGLDLAAVDAAVRLLHEVRLARGVVLTAGNGGSSSTASHFAGDLMKFPNLPHLPHLRATALTDNVACHTAWLNDDEPGSALVHLAEPWLQGATDATATAVVAFSVHGGARDGSVSNNLVALARHARRRGAGVVAVTGFDGGALGDLADVHVNVAMRHEPLATPGIESVHLLVAHALCLGLLELGRKSNA